MTDALESPELRNDERFRTPEARSQNRAVLEEVIERIQSQLDRLESAGAELADATQAAIEQAAREPAALRRGRD